jgi:hypothetical protein
MISLESGDFLKNNWLALIKQDSKYLSSRINIGELSSPISLTVNPFLVNIVSALLFLSLKDPVSNFVLIFKKVPSSFK